jgi:hypothetical protein
VDESSRKEGVELTKLMFIKAKMILTVDNIFDCGLMIEDHLGLSFFLSFSCFMVFDEDFRIEIGVGISFHLTGCI